MRVARQLTLEEARPRPRLPPLSVLPDAGRVEERLVSLAQPFAAGRRACTLAELERDVVRAARAASACPRVAAPEALSFAVQRACREATPRGSAFHRIREQPGFARAAQDLLAALAQGMVEPAELSRLEIPDGPRERIGALAAVFVDARERLAARGLIDANGALLRAIDALERGVELPVGLAQAARITFEWILDWTPLRVRLAAALAARLGPGRVVVRLPWPGDRPELREALDPALRAFEALGGSQAAPELELFDPAEGSRLSSFLGRLFSPGAGERDPNVALRACASPAAQAREVAGACADLLARGAPPESIAVVARSLGGGVAEELGAALDRLSVPWRERRGRPALPAPPSQLALSLYDACERRFPRESVELLLCSRLLWISDDGDRLPGHVLVRTLRQAHVRDDATDGGYAARLDALASRMHARAEEDCARALAEIEETKRRVQRILEALRALPARGTLREHGSALLALLEQWGLARRLRRGEGDDAGALGRAAVAALARDQAALAALEEACEALVRGAEAVGEGDLLCSRAEWAQALASALGDASLPPRGARGGAVQLCELRELAGRRFDHVLVVGLVDGELPARPAVDPLLSDEDRRAVNRAAGRAVFRAAPEGKELALLPPRQV